MDIFTTLAEIADVLNDLTDEATDKITEKAIKTADKIVSAANKAINSENNAKTAAEYSNNTDAANKEAVTDNAAPDDRNATANVNDANATGNTANTATGDTNADKIAESAAKMYNDTVMKINNLAHRARCMAESIGKSNDGTIIIKINGETENATDIPSLVHEAIAAVKNSAKDLTDSVKDDIETAIAAANERATCRITTDNIANSITHVIYRDNATIVFFKDGTKSVAKCDAEDVKNGKYDPMTGVSIAVLKRLIGNATYRSMIFSQAYAHNSREQSAAVIDPEHKTIDTAIDIDRYKGKADAINTKNTDKTEKTKTAKADKTDKAAAKKSAAKKTSSAKTDKTKAAGKTTTKSATKKTKSSAKDKDSKKG